VRLPPIAFSFFICYDQSVLDLKNINKYFFAAF
jgi:hypothetical protein